MATKKSKPAALRMFSTRNDMPVKQREHINQLLNEQLADLFDLYSQAKQAHWNVKGQEFFQLHKLFDDLAEMLLKHLDDIAERITALGGIALGTVTMAANSSRLPEYTTDIVGSTASLRALSVRFGLAGKTVRAAIKSAEEEEDLGTVDLLSQVSLDLDKGLWFLEAHLQEK
jgi:starvation-inducible DNA-binding protein